MSIKPFNLNILSKPLSFTQDLLIVLGINLLLICHHRFIRKTQYFVAETKVKTNTSERGPELGDLVVYIRAFD
jgi:hypothetical protein